MTPDHDIERVLDRWLTEGPSQMPSRFFDETLDRIDRMPSGRLVGLRTRARAARPDLRLVVAAAVILAVAAVSTFAVFGGSGVGAGPSPTPTVAPSASAAAVVDPALLAAKWTSVGGRVYPGVMASDTIVDPMDIRFDDAKLSINGFKGWVDSSWTVGGPDGHLTVDMVSTQASLTNQHWDCRPGQTGAYIVFLSPDRSTLTLSSIVDDCVDRAAILGGAWTRWPCPNPDSTCAPELTPGRHGFAFVPNIDPNEPSVPPTFIFAAVLPSGWSRIEGSNTLARPNDPGTMGINLILDVAPHSQAADCADAVEPGVGSTAKALADWLATLPGLVATAPAPISIGGHDGWMLDLAVKPTWTLPCQQYYEAPARVVLTFADPVPPSDGGTFIREAIERDGHSRVVLLDVGDGHNLLIEIVAPDEASWDDLVQAAMPIVESMEFSP